MTHFNSLSASLKCPYCGEPALQRLKLAFGETRVMGSYCLGDRYPWRPGLPVERGGRPADGHFLGDSSSRCLACNQVFNVRIRIRSDIISSVEPYPAPQTASPTRWLDGRVQARGHIPDPARSQLDDDLIGRVRSVLDRMQAGDIGLHNTETCLLLYDLGEAMRQKGQIRTACQAFYNAYIMAVQLELTGWSTLASEAARELRQEFDLSRADCEISVPVQELLSGCLGLFQSTEA
jgi:hypothetical protein